MLTLKNLRNLPCRTPLIILNHAPETGEYWCYEAPTPVRYNGKMTPYTLYIQKASEYGQETRDQISNPGARIASVQTRV